MPVVVILEWWLMMAYVYHILFPSAAQLWSSLLLLSWTVASLCRCCWALACHCLAPRKQLLILKAKAVCAGVVEVGRVSVRLHI
jgi:hypothetical protein